MKKIEEQTCIRFEERNKNEHKELVDRVVSQSVDTLLMPYMLCCIATRDFMFLEFRLGPII